MVTPEKQTPPPLSQRPVFEASHFSIDQLSSSPEGLEIHARSIGRTAGKALSLSPSQKEQLRLAMPGEMKFRGVDAVKQTREAWRSAQSAEAPEDEIMQLRDTFFSTRERYLRTGKKLGLRNIRRSGADPNTIEAEAGVTDYLTYTLFSKPETTGTLGEVAQLTGVAMALTTADNRLILQHRAAESFDYITNKKIPGNGLYSDIPGVSVAGMADATFTSDGRRAGTPDDVSTAFFEASILKEAGEELGLGPEHFSSKKIVGIAHDHIKPHSEVLFLATTQLTSAELRAESLHSNRNKNLSEADLEEKYLDIAATPEAIQTLLTEVKSPLPPTHAAAYVAAGHAIMLEQAGEQAATTWLTHMEQAVAENYKAIDEKVRQFYINHPEALAVVPERMWSKKVVPERNAIAYDPAFTPEEQGLPNLEDELVRTGLIAETRQRLARASLFDVDGVLTDPTEKRVTDPRLFDEIIARLNSGEFIALNTGRSTTWLTDNFLSPLLGRIDDTTILPQLFCVGEKGGTWATINGEKQVSYGQIPSLRMPEELMARVQEIVNDKYANQMFYDNTKQTMISVEMKDGGDLETFHSYQHAFHEDMRLLLHELGLESTYRIDPTTIATDIESPHATKALGAQRFIQYLKSQDAAYASAKFEAFGDSPSDAAMADELARHGLDTTFVFVGNPLQLTEQSLHYPVITEAGYNNATLRYLANKSS